MTLSPRRVAEKRAALDNCKCGNCDYCWEKEDAEGAVESRANAEKAVASWEQSDRDALSRLRYPDTTGQ
jgi:hypothetical protein